MNRKTPFFILITVVLFFSLLEMGIRLFDIIFKFSNTDNQYFIAKKINGKGYISTNKKWLSSEQKYGMLEETFLQEKEPDVFRIFSLGGSFMNLFITGALKKTLCECSTPDGRRFEIINAAGAGFDSFRILDIAREVVQYQPDLILTATGNNEFLNQETDIFIKKKRDSYYEKIRTYRLLRKLVLYFKNAIRKTGILMLFTSEGELVPVKTKISKMIKINDATRKNHSHYFAQNVRSLARLLNERGVDATFLVLPINDRFPVDFFSGTGDRSQKYKYQRELHSMFRLLKKGECRKAFKGFKQVYGEKPGRAALIYMEAVEAEVNGEFKRAKQLYRETLYYDARPTRSNDSFNETVKEIEDDYGIPVVDLDFVFMKKSLDNGKKFNDYLFIDQCHPNRIGEDVVINAIMEHLVQRGILTDR